MKEIGTVSKEALQHALHAEKAGGMKDFLNRNGKKAFVGGFLVWITPIPALSRVGKWAMALGGASWGGSKLIHGEQSNKVSHVPLKSVSQEKILFERKAA